jgi:hypothetical protein
MAIIVDVKTFFCGFFLNKKYNFFRCPFSTSAATFKGKDFGHVCSR